MTLKEVLDCNPWKIVADDWFAEMRKKDSGYQYVLSEDIETIRAYEPQDEKNHSFECDVPPQPFVGNPFSKIWFFLKNPGIGPWDYCDFINGKKGLEKQVYAEDVADTGLLRRQELYCRQLKFDGEKGKEFFLLDDSFKTATKGGYVPRCIYWWYAKVFFSKEGIFSKYINVDDDEARLAFASKNIFVLDYVPYRSSKFDDAANLNFAHTAFWRKMAKAALLDQEKTLVFWGSKIINRIKGDAELAPLYYGAVKQGRVLVIKGQQAYFSANNVFSPVADGILDGKI